MAEQLRGFHERATRTNKDLIQKSYTYYTKLVPKQLSKGLLVYCYITLTNTSRCYIKRAIEHFTTTSQRCDCTVDPSGH